MAKKEALALINSVNKVMEKEAYRPQDKKGRPGAVVSLPGKLTPVLVGDLHAKPDNLLTILSATTSWRPWRKGAPAW